MKSLIIDNYDSFTYNLFQMMAEVNGIPPLVIRNDEISFSELKNLEYDQVVISPGPGHPEIFADFGISKQVLTEIDKPILGVCLGHQGLCCAFGGTVIHAPSPMHGRLSKIIHQGDELFKDIPNEFHVVRYHSLLSAHPLPDCLETIAWAEDNLIMGLKHKTKPLWGVQFHPESICSEYGYQILQNFRNLTEKHINRSSHSLSTQLNTPLQNSKKISAVDTTTQLKTANYEILIKKIPDFFAPQDVFLDLFKHQKYAVWLDSNKSDSEMSRFSFMGSLEGPLSYLVKYQVTSKKITILRKQKHHEMQEENLADEISIFDFLDAELKKFSIKHDFPFQFSCGFVGYFGYELKCETTPTINHHVSSYPDAQFLFLDRVIVFDHIEKCCYLLALAEQNGKVEAENWLREMEKRLFEPPHPNPLPRSGGEGGILTPHQDPLLRNIGEGGILSPHEDPLFRNRGEGEILAPHFQNGGEILPLSQFYLSRNQETYLQDIQKCLNFIRDGESYEICLTNQLKYSHSINPLNFYLSLRQKEFAPYSAFLNLGELAIACASIERFVKIDAHGLVETKPIKGTISRGESQAEDQKLIQYLANHEKFKAENLMIVDLLRNDLGKVCEVGSVHVPKLMAVETYDTVHQLVSTIRGKLCADINAIDCIKALFPGGSMTGAPKIRTLNILDTLENEARGIYSGALGYLSLNGAADFNIVIRTAVISPHELSIGAGGAIIDLSDPLKEYEEMLLKAKSLQKALNCLVPKS